MIRPRYILALFLAVAVSSVWAQEPTPVKVLVVTGGHAFEEAPFLEVFRDNSEIVFTHAQHTEGTADVFDRVNPGDFDVVVLYDQPLSLTATQKATFLAMFDQGVGLVATHHALVSYQRWPDYERIIGGRWFDLPQKGGDPNETPSGYEHDVDIPVVVATGHPVTAGLGNFTIHDEIYWGFRVRADVTPLATTPHPKSGNPLAWARTEGRSRVVYLLFGHGPPAFRDPNYRRLLGNSIRWAARR